MKKAFTITELLVAMGLLAAVLAGAGMVFHYSVDAQRTASATSEIMRNLRAITDQINADFEGICVEAQLGLYYNDSNGVRADRIVLFSTGDFRTTRQYDDETVAGNVARIFYGQSVFLSNICPDPLSSTEEDRREKILVRKQIILTPDSTLTISNPDPPDNDPYEYKTTSLADEITFYVLEGGQAKYDWGIRPEVDPNNKEDIPMFLARGVDDFTIQADANDRFDPNDVLNWVDADKLDRYPNAIKFTFTLYDSKGIIEGGRRFTHIVYIGD